MTKHDLKVGDWARIVRYDGFSPNCNHLGTEGIIKSITPSGYCDLEAIKGLRSGNLSDLEPIPTESPKDPFAPGEYVTAISFGPWWMPGQIEISEGEIALRPDYFGSNGRAYKKSSFRPATPEEIAAYKTKYETEPKPICASDADLSITAPECSFGEKGQTKSRITFTVGGQEFYVGQRVWSLVEAEDFWTVLSKGDELEIRAYLPNSAQVVCSLPNDPRACLFDVDQFSTTPPTPHEWKRGDWARHDTHGDGFVCHVNASGSLMISFDGLATTLFNGKDVDFIGHSEVPK